MGDLHSISCSSRGLQSSVWDFHDIEVFNPEMSQFLDSTTPFVSFLESHYSTGYLEDALFKFSSKRRRLLLFADDHNMDGPTYKECLSNYDHFCQRMSMSSCDTMSGESMSTSVTTIIEDSYPLIGIKTPEDAISTPDEELIKYSSPSSNSIQKDSICNHFSSGNENERRKKRKLSTQVAYPFAVIKPGGYEGDATLNEINKKILMPPIRPVMHPVGDFACRPLVVSPDGPGLSGKPVVAMQRIQTQGRGTITIIRTRG
ncbi:hypothetical protein Leryth_009270 [Lithospermum erythrorhizon]|nr:hypothetical protein Leryth_009270 [Lithospermum erythrorhizon]